MTRESSSCCLPVTLHHKLILYFYNKNAGLYNNPVKTQAESTTMRLSTYFCLRDFDYKNSSIKVQSGTTLSIIELRSSNDVKHKRPLPQPHLVS